MPQPMPRLIRRLTETPLKGKGDWVRRSRRARDLLIERHGFRAKDFVEVTRDGYGPCLNMCSLYPAHWAARHRKSPKRGRRRRFDWVSYFPAGLVVYNPGPDYWGEASDDRDTILMLAELEHWNCMSDDEIEALLHEPRTSAKTPEVARARA